MFFFFFLSRPIQYRNFYRFAWRRPTLNLLFLAGPYFEFFDSPSAPADFTPTKVALVFVKRRLHRTLFASWCVYCMNVNLNCCVIIPKRSDCAMLHCICKAGVTLWRLEDSFHARCVRNLRSRGTRSCTKSCTIDHGMANAMDYDMAVAGLRMRAFARAQTASASGAMTTGSFPHVHVHARIYAMMRFAVVAVAVCTRVACTNSAHACCACCAGAANDRDVLVRLRCLQK